ncbi:DUF7146 domain-containing protein [Granulibacter bethesdensis]|uniref:DUF7146 domain-containing protein n=1 Tax=Granulibacter bethesdensis TaxID=364410 RepID=UPI0004BA6A4A|nr:CHC2 zinc finger domain-containing protein [Granulibacter bethesdensis]
MVSRSAISDAFLDDLCTRVPVPALIGEVVRLKKQGRHWSGCCPFHDETNPSFAVYDNGFFCFGCGAKGDAITWIQHRHGCGFIEAVSVLAVQVGMTPPSKPPENLPVKTLPAMENRHREEQQRQAALRRADALQMFVQADALIVDTPVDFYLRSRGIDLRRLGAWPRSLRYHPSLYHHPSGKQWPAMLAAVTNGTGEHVATHRTWLAPRPDGGWGKAPVENPKMSLGDVFGGCIRLWRGASRKALVDAPADERPVCGEGIETCLSWAVEVPEDRVLATVSLSNFQNLQLPTQIKQIAWLVDGDSKPMAQRQLQRALNKHIEAGRRVFTIPSPYGKDFNDALMRKLGLTGPPALGVGHG